jgi:O-antigen ligase
MTVGKPIVTFLTAFAMAVVGFWSDHFIDTVEWINIGIIFVSLFAVYITPNLNAGLGKYAKMIGAGLFAALTLLVTFLSSGVDASEWVQVIVAFVGAFGVIVPKAPQYSISTGTLQRAIG